MVLVCAWAYRIIELAAGLPVRVTSLSGPLVGILLHMQYRNSALLRCAFQLPQNAHDEFNVLRS